MNIREMRQKLGDTQSEFAQRYHIPFRTIQNWEEGSRKPPEYVLYLVQEQIQRDLVNHKTFQLPKYDPHKIDLPKRSDFVGSLAWLKAVNECIGEKIIFALDEALMCEGSFTGRNDEYLIWVYGDDSLSRFNGVVVLGNEIAPHDIKEKNGLCYTTFNRTITDALANEDILDMQGITEALSKYYFQNSESFDGLFIGPEYQKGFDVLASEAMDYYED